MRIGDDCARDWPGASWTAAVHGGDGASEQDSRRKAAEMRRSLKKAHAQRGSARNRTAELLADLLLHTTSGKQRSQCAKEVANQRGKPLTSFFLDIDWLLRSDQRQSLGLKLTFVWWSGIVNVPSSPQTRTSDRAFFKHWPPSVLGRCIHRLPSFQVSGTHLGLPGPPTACSRGTRFSAGGSSGNDMCGSA